MKSVTGFLAKRLTARRLLFLIGSIALVLLFLLRGSWQPWFFGFFFPRQDKLDLLKSILDIFNGFLAVFLAYKTFFQKADGIRYSEEEKLLIPTSPEMILNSVIGSKGGKINWVNRNAVSPSVLYKHPHLIITGRMKIGKTREAAELIRQVLNEEKVTEDYVFDLSYSLRSFTPETAREYLNKKLDHGTPLIILINDLPKQYSGIELDTLSAVLDGLKQCNRYYIVATGRIDQLTEEHQKWLESHRFYQAKLEKLSEDNIKRLVDNIAGLLNLQIDNSVRDEFAKRSDGTPAQIFLALIRLKNNKDSLINLPIAHAAISKTLEESWAEIREAIIVKHPRVEYLFRSMAAFYQMREFPQRVLVFDFARLLEVKEGGRKIDLFGAYKKEFEKAINLLEHYDVSVQNDIIYYPDVLIENIQLSLPATIDYLRDFLQRRHTLRNTKNRAILLRSMENFWIKGVLEKSLYGQALIELQLDHQPNPTNIDKKVDSQRSLHQSSQIAEVFDEAHGKLLILGEPGSGKTTLLLELARQLIYRARSDDNQPIPVIFNFSSWDSRYRSIDEWLVDELNVKYQVSQKLGKFWLSTNQLILLIDGLDEVRNEFRISCVQAINRFLSKNIPAQIVVCSRTLEYKALNPPLDIHAATIIQPLSDHQVAQYFRILGLKYQELMKALQQDDGLRTLARSPLMLSIIALSYEGKSNRDLPITTFNKTSRMQLIETYVNARIRAKGNDDYYSEKQAKKWLSFLSFNLIKNSQTVLLFENIEPSWLKNNPQYRKFEFYWRVSVGMCYGLISGVIGGILLSYILRLDISLITLAVGFILGSLYGFMLGINTRLGNVVKRNILHFMLYRNGDIPWNITRFLDWTTYQGITLKVGQGYLFIHQLLLEYFASLWITES